MDKYEFKIDTFNKRIIIEDESGLCVDTDYINSDSKSPSLAIVTNSFDVSLIQAWRNYTERRKEIDEIKVGSWVKIVNNGKMYSTNIKWFEINTSFNVAARYAYDSYEIDNPDDAYYVICKAPHTDWNDVELCAISKSSYDKVYLIDVSGLKKVDKRG